MYIICQWYGPTMALWGSRRKTVNENISADIARVCVSLYSEGSQCFPLIMYTFNCLADCLSAFLSIYCIPVTLRSYLSLNQLVSLCSYLSVSVLISLCSYLSVRLPVSLNSYLSVRLPVSLRSYRFVSLPVSLIFFLSVSLHVICVPVYQ